MKISNEFKIGFWAIVAIVVLIAGIDFLKGINRFKPGNSYYVVCPNVEGLAVSSHVLLNGYKVGLVRNMKYDAIRQGNIIVEIDVEDDVKIPADSRALVQTDLLGTSSVVLQLGTSPDLIASHDTISGGGKAANMLDQIQPVIPEVTAMLPKIDSILTGLNVLVNESELQGSLHNINALTAQLNTTVRQLNSLLNKDMPGLVNHAANAAANLDTLSQQIKEAGLDKTIADANAALYSANSLLSRLTDTNSSASKLLNTTELHDGLMATVAGMDSLIADIKQHPGRYINISVFGNKKK